MAHLSSSGTLVEEEHSLVPPTWENTVRAIGVSEYKEAGLSLAYSFASDHLSVYLLDGDDMAQYSAEKKWKLHVNIMTYLTAAHMINGTVTVLGPDYDCVGLWMPPGTNIDGWAILFRSGLWRLYFQLSTEGFARYNDELMPLLSKTKLEVMGERDNDCYYLVYLGTKNNSRGKGYARKLIEDMIKKADAEKRAMYLESSSKTNCKYYEKFGFELRKEIALSRAKHPIPLYIMVREPGATPRTAALPDPANLKADGLTV